MSKKEKEVEETPFQEVKNRTSPPLDASYDPEVPEGGDLHPPQDLNLKLQLEKENSIALTRMLQQLQADFENFRKRNSKSEEESYKRGVADAVKILLVSYDAMVSALKTVEDEQIRKGLEMVERAYLAGLKEMEITPIAACGEMFDPNLHNAIMSEEVKDKASGIIIEELQRGFNSPGGVIRYSTVRIAK